MIKTSIHRAIASLLPIVSRVGVHSGGVAIIMLHGVYESTSGPIAPPASSVSLQALGTSIAKLRKSYSFISMDEVAAMFSGKTRWRKRSLALTFDDSLVCHAEVVAPKLAQWGIPATFYLSTETIDKRVPYWWLRLEHVLSKARGQKIRVALPGGAEVRADASDPSARRTLCTAIRTVASTVECARAVESVEDQLAVKPDNKEYPFAEPMTWDQARQLVKLGMNVGSHTVSHPNLTLLNAAELRSEFEVSRKRIEEQCAAPCRHLCYPYGFYSETVCEVARAAGYSSAVTTDSGVNQRNADVFKLRRLAMPKQAFELSYSLLKCSVTAGAQ
jgi:peptidoglycan/xylan/chitin deacetylase (PgdA/CDA1 family)